MPGKSGIQFVQATFAFTITKNDSGTIATDVGNTPGYDLVNVYVTGTGDVKVKTADGVDYTWTAVPANSVLGNMIPLLVSKVYSTGTTATGLIGLAAKQSLS